MFGPQRTIFEKTLATRLGKKKKLSHRVQILTENSGFCRYEDENEGEKPRGWDTVPYSNEKPPWACEESGVTKVPYFEYLWICGL